MYDFVEAVNDFLQLLYSIAPKEIWIIVFACIVMYIQLEYTDWKNKKQK
jgi:hypothetical protein